MEGIKHEELEHWLQGITSIDFEHVSKKRMNGWGHVHFATRADALRLFNEMEGRVIKGPSNYGSIIFSAATSFRAKAAINYNIYRRVHEKPEKTEPGATNISTHRQGYALYEENGFYFVKIHTPGVQKREQVNIDVGEDDQTVTITAEVNDENCEDFTKIKNDLLTNFKVDIMLPRKINTDHLVSINITHGIIIAKFKIQGNKRKIQII